MIFAAGLVVIAVAVIGFFLGVHNWPTWLNVCCGVFAPLGMALALIGAFSGGRRDQKAALRAVNQAALRAADQGAAQPADHA